MAIPSDIFVLMGVYAAIFFGTIFAINFMTGGFVFAWLIVKTSAGRKILIRSRSAVTDYYLAGSISESFIKFKVRGSKEYSLVALPKMAVFRCFKVDCADYNETVGAFALLDYSVVSAHDPEKTNHLLTRALYKPGMPSANLTLFTFIGVVLLVLAVGFVAITVIKNQELLKQVLTACTVKSIVV